MKTMGMATIAGRGRSVALVALAASLGGAGIAAASTTRLSRQQGETKERTFHAPALDLIWPDYSTTAFVHVGVIPMDRERVLADQTVIVHGGRITEIGSSDGTPVPSLATRIDGRGRFLLPGLAEMHAHIPGVKAGAAFTRRVLDLYLAGGVTTIRGMLGEPSHLELRDRIARGEILGPRIVTSGPSLNGRSVPDPESARRAVRQQAAAGYDFLKLHPGLTRATFDAIVATADSVGLRFAGHVSLQVGLHRALEAHQATVDHLDGYLEALLLPGAPVTSESSRFFGFNLVPYLDEAGIAVLAAETKAAGVWNVPTQSLFTEFASTTDPGVLARRADLRYMPASIVAGWVRRIEQFRERPDYSPERARRFIDFRRKIIRALHDAGAGILLGSDAPQVFNVPGFSVHEELRALVAAGLTPYEALEAGTRSVAEFLGELAERGTVQEGKRADLLLLEANPLEDVGATDRIAGVMVGGRWLSGEDLRRRLEKIVTGGTR